MTARNAYTEYPEKQAKIILGALILQRLCRKKLIVRPEISIFEAKKTIEVDKKDFCLPNFNFKGRASVI